MDDPLGEPLDDGGLADAGLAEEDGVVLRAAGEDLHHPLDLVHAADHGVELVLLRELREVAAEGVEGGGLRLARRGGLLPLGGLGPLLGPLRGALGRVGPEQLDDLLAHFLGLDAEVLQHVGGGAVALADEPEQEVLGPDVVVAQRLGLLHGELEDPLRAGREGELGAGDGARALLHQPLDLGADLAQVDVEVLQDLGRDAAALLHEPEQDVLGPDVVVVELLRLLPREGHDLAGALCETVEHRGDLLVDSWTDRSAPRRPDKLRGSCRALACARGWCGRRGRGLVRVRRLPALGGTLPGSPVSADGREVRGT